MRLMNYAKEVENQEQLLIEKEWHAIIESYKLQEGEE